MRGVVGFAFGKNSGGGDPARAASHDLDDATGTVISGHAADVGGDFHDGAGVVLGNGAKAGAMISVRQIVINCFGDADDAHFMAAAEGFLMKFIGGVLRIVAADIEEIANVVGLK